MSKLLLLDQNTINQIAAGEVVERPASVVKELVENAIDAAATAITVEIRDGGIALIRITDNGTGIEKEDIKLAFLRHSTSKISSIEDLLTVGSLGFRGEALASIASVAQIEIVTKHRSAYAGARYCIEGGVDTVFEEVGCPDGTTILVRHLFYNTPARRKFLKTPMTEAGHVSDLMERMALSRPDISIKFIKDNKTILHTSGNGNQKEVIYEIYGRDITSKLLEVQGFTDGFAMQGFIGKPEVARGNRNYENYYINQRYIKSPVIGKSMEEAYKPFFMQHKFPFTVLYFTIDPTLLDVNVHPTKMEVRFIEGERLYKMIYGTIRTSLSGKTLIPEFSITDGSKKAPLVETKPDQKLKSKLPEPFEKERRKEWLQIKEPQDTIPMEPQDTIPMVREEAEPLQLSIFHDDKEKFIKQHRLVGQLFLTYWLVESQDQLYIIDQHAAHEKIIYESLMLRSKKQEFLSQMLKPPLIVSLTLREEEALRANKEALQNFGFEIEHFGGKEYSIHAIPLNLYGLEDSSIFIEFLDLLMDQPVLNSVPERMFEKLASVSCKAAVKGNHTLSFPEAEALINQLLKLDNPFHCPHGRPTIITMSQYELEKKFKR